MDLEKEMRLGEEGGGRIDAYIVIRVRRGGEVWAGDGCVE